MSERIYLTLENLDDFPKYALPPGFRIEPLGGRDFYEIHSRVGTTRSIDEGIVDVQYSGNRKALSDCCLLLFDKSEVIGIGVAWWNPNVFGERWGVVDWLSVDKPYQAKGLSRPFLSAVLRRVSLNDCQCYADTEVGNVAAVRLALSFGFKPKFDSEKGRALWHGVAKKINNPGLTKILENDGFR